MNPRIKKLREEYQAAAYPLYAAEVGLALGSREFYDLHDQVVELQSAYQRAVENGDDTMWAYVSPTVIVTRHAGLVAWLAARGIEGPIVAQATAADVRGRVVVGALPLHLAALAAEVVAVDMPGLTPAQRGQDLTPAEMDAAGARLTRYRVTRL